MNKFIFVDLRSPLDREQLEEIVYKMEKDQLKELEQIVENRKWQLERFGRYEI